MCKQSFTVSDGLRAVVNRVSSVKNILLLVAGASCCGKTYFCRLLSRELTLGGFASTILPMDSYFKDIDDSSLPRGRNGEPFFDHPGAYHLDEVQRDVLALIGGSSIALPNYNMDQNKRLPGNGGILLPTPTVIVDGLFAIDLDFGQEINTLSVYIDAPPETRLRRRIDRDEEKYGVPKKVVSEAFWSRIEPQSRLYIEPQKDCADIVVRSEEGCSCL